VLNSREFVAKWFFDQRLSAQISGEKKGLDFDLLRVSVPPWWILVLVVGCG